jgi:hypothetical protein
MPACVTLAAAVPSDLAALHREEGMYGLLGYACKASTAARKDFSDRAHEGV